MTEEQFKQKIKEQFKTTPLCWCRKFPGSAMSAGMPDIIGCIEYIGIAIEAKVFTLPKRTTTAIQPFKKITPLQYATIQDINKNGGNAFEVSAGLNQTGKIEWIYITKDHRSGFILAISNIKNLMGNLKSSITRKGSQ